MTVWKLQEAKAQFSRVVENALKIGPQYVTRRGTKAVVVLSARDYEDLVSTKPSFKTFLLNCPKIEGGLDVKRERDVPRSVEL